jgi:hypothetical protein
MGDCISAYPGQAGVLPWPVAGGRVRWKGIFRELAALPKLGEARSSDTLVLVPLMRMWWNR